MTKLMGGRDGDPAEEGPPMTDSDIAELLARYQDWLDSWRDRYGVSASGSDLRTGLVAALRQVRGERDTALSEVANAPSHAALDEATAREAALREALQACAAWMSTVLQGFSVGKLEAGHPLLKAQTLLANPSPAAPEQEAP